MTLYGRHKYYAHLLPSPALSLLHPLPLLIFHNSPSICMKGNEFAVLYEKQCHFPFILVLDRNIDTLNSLSLQLNLYSATQ